MIQTAPLKPGSITPSSITPSSAALGSSRPQTEASSTNGTLRVGLQAVLNSLDVQLETELARYRRYKRLQQNGQASGSSVSFSLGGGALGVDLPPVTANSRVAAAQMPTASANATRVGSQAAPVPRVSPQAAGSPDQAPAQSLAQSLAQPDAVSLNAGGTARVSTPAASLEPAAMLDRWDVKSEAQSEAQSVAQSMAQSEAQSVAQPAARADVPTQGQVALASSLVQVGTGETAAPGMDLGAGSLVPHPTAFGAWTQMGDGAVEHSSLEGQQNAYFESSAALLEHLAGEPVLDEPEAIASPGWIGRLTSPMGIGLSLVLLVASGAVGYLWANPNSVSHLKFVLIPPVPQPNPSPTVQVSEDTPAGPNLAQQEFVDLSLSNLGLVNTQPGVNRGLAGIPGSTLIPPGSTLPGIPTNAAVQSPGAGSVPGTRPGTLPTTLPGALPVSPGLQALPPVPTSPEANAASAPNPTGSPSASTPKPGLLSGLASAVSGNSVLRSLSSGPPLPAVLQPAPTQTPTASPKSTAKPATRKPAASQPATSQSATSQPATSPSAASKPAASKPATSQPAASKPASSAQSSLPEVPLNATFPVPPDQGGGFSVLVPFQGDESLAQIKAFAADAFVNTAGKIQVGIYDDAESARALAEFLRNQGINAEIGYP